MKKTILVYSITFIIIICVFLLSLFLISLFPSNLLKENVQESAEILLQEGNLKKQYILIKQRTMDFDNYTDALMINTAYSIDNKTPLYSALIARKNYLPRNYKNSKRGYNRRVKICI